MAHMFVWANFKRSNMSVLESVKQDLMKDPRNKLLMDYIDDLIKQEVETQVQLYTASLKTQVYEDIAYNICRGLQ